VAGALGDGRGRVIASGPRGGGRARIHDQEDAARDVVHLIRHVRGS